YNTTTYSSSNSVAMAPIPMSIARQPASCCAGGEAASLMTGGDQRWGAPEGARGRRRGLMRWLSSARLQGHDGMDETDHNPLRDSDATGPSPAGGCSASGPTRVLAPAWSVPPTIAEDESPPDGLATECDEPAAPDESRPPLGET